MAVYETPIREERYVERDSGSSAGIWAAVIVIVALLALILFGFRFFGRGTNTDGGTNINGTINLPPSNDGGTGTK